MSLFSCHTCGSKRNWKNFPNTGKVTVCSKDYNHGLGERFIDYIENGVWKLHDVRIYERSKKGHVAPGKIKVDLLSAWTSGK